jgi:hypothetical protein
MKKLGFLTLLMAIAVMLGATALAQDYSRYFTTYYSNANTANVPDATVRIINDGSAALIPVGPQGPSAQGADLYANIYVFDDSEELTECCSCLVTPDGLLSESVNKNLTANPITGIKPTRGVIKIITSDVSGGNIGLPTNGLHGWATHVQKLASGFAVTETLLADSNLAPSEEGLLYELCYYDGELSGQPCTCTPEDQDF